MKRQSTAAIAALAVLALSGCAGQAQTANGQQTVKVGHVKSVIFAPLYVAQAKGYCEKQGIKLELETVKSGQDAVPLAASGKLDAVVAGFSAGMFSAISAGLDVKVVGSMGISDGNEEAPTAALIGSKSKFDSGEIKSATDLKGKKIAAAGGPGGAAGYLIDNELHKVGLSAKDVELVNLGHPDMPSALANGSIDAAFSNPPFTTNMIADGVGVQFSVPVAGTNATGVIFGGRFTTDPRAQKLFNCLSEGARDLANGAGHSDENAAIIADATGQETATVKDQPLYSWLPNLAPQTEQLSAMQKSWIDLKALELDQPLEPEKYVNTSFADSVK